MSAHAKFSPSAIERIMACPGSVKASIGIERKDTRSSKEGTRAHECLEMFLKNGPKKAVSTQAFLFETYPMDMIEIARNAATFLWQKSKKVESEKKVSLPHIDANLWGTLDAVIEEPFETLEIADFKYGKYMPVEVEENGQLLTYAAGEAYHHHYNFKKIRLTIIQPRAKHENGPVRSWDCSVDTIREWEEKLRVAISAAKAPKPKLFTGEHCFFCPAKLNCKTFDPQALKPFKSRFIREKVFNKKELLNVFGGASLHASDDDDQW